MSDRTVTVFGASGRQGQAQVRQLLASGARTRAVSRNPEIFRSPELRDAAVVPADYGDPASLAAVCADADAVVFQPPQAVRPDLIPGYVQAVAEAARGAAVATFVHNSTMWAPAVPCGQAYYDAMLAIENLLASFELPLVVFRPTLWFNSCLPDLGPTCVLRDTRMAY